MQYEDPYEENDGVCDPGDLSCNWLPDSEPEDEVEESNNNPDEELKEETSEQYTPEVLTFCVNNPFTPSCAPLLPPQTCPAVLMNLPPGSEYSPPGCRYVGTRDYYDWGRVNKADLFINILGLVGFGVAVIGTLNIVSFGPAIAFYEATQFIGLAYDIYKLDPGPLTWDLVTTVVDETHFIPKMAPGFNLLTNWAGILEALEGGRVTERVYEPVIKIYDFTP